MNKLFISLFFLIICNNANCENIKIINDKPGTGIEIVNHSKIKVHYVGKLANGTEILREGALSAEDLIAAGLRL